MKQNNVVVGAVGLGGESVFLTVDHFHAPGETLQADGLFVEAGGKAYNQAVAAARLGAKVLFFGAVGDDSSGEMCRNVLTSEGIEPILQVVPGKNTAYASILTDRTGENQVTVSRGAADRLSASFIFSREADFARCTHLILGLECPLEATEAATELARKYNIFTILNPAPAFPLNFDFLRSFDLITPNLQEAAVLLGLAYQPKPKELAAKLRDAGLVKTVVTLGSRGSLLVAEDECLLFPAVPVKAVDTTGAGDTFNAALAVSLGNGHSLREAIEYATNASSCSVRVPHVLPSLPTDEQLRADYHAVVPVPL
ncbi:MAG: ribokinase [Candidatus Limivicinus sp.]